MKERVQRPTNPEILLDALFGDTYSSCRQSEQLLPVLLVCPGNASIGFVHALFLLARLVLPLVTVLEEESL
jgi:hypothetical protein